MFAILTKMAYSINELIDIKSSLMGEHQYVLTSPVNTTTKN